MKKKLYLGIVACLFVAATAINVSLAHHKQNNNVLLANIAVMAQAQDENPIGMGCYEGRGPGNGFIVDCRDCRLYMADPLGAHSSCFP